MNVEIVTPDKKVFEGEAKHVQLPGKSGLLGILDNHAPIISSLAKGNVKVDGNDGQTHNFAINGGVVEVKANKVIVLAEA